MNADARGPHRLYLASAGTGKTYRLATHFAALLTAGVEPQRVLATTFTRKAAGEILDRVLARLVDAARDDERGEATRKELASEAEACLGLRPRADRGAALARLAELAREIGRFQVRTLDAFFVQVARLFAFELALMPEWHIADDVEDEEMRADVLTTVIGELGPDERRTLLVALARTGAPLVSHTALSKTVSDALHLHREAVPGAWEVVNGRSGPSEAEFAAAVEHLCTFRLPRNKTPKGGVFEEKKFWKAFQEVVGGVLERRDWIEWLGLGLPKKVRASEISFDRAPIPDDVAEAVRVVDRAAAAAMLAELAAENHATGEVCLRYSARERAVKDQRGAYRFEDFPRALAEGPADAEDEEARALWRFDLGYRLDARVEHLLLDEFQDTAPQQWRLLLPLAEEILAGGDGEVPRTFFCVGDVKQSIYGWRAAEPRLLAELHEEFPVLEPQQLAQSWRSSPVVLGTVNQIFEGLAQRQHFAGDDHEALRERAQQWGAGYSEHTRAPGAGPCPGAAFLIEAVPRTVASGAQKDEPKNAACIRVAVERVANLVARAPQASVAVLVRAKAVIPQLLYLLRERGIDASGEGGNPLTDTAPVAQVLALLHLADHPADRLAALGVVHSALAELFDLAGIAVDDPEQRPRLENAAREVRRELVERGYGATIQRLGGAFAPSWSTWERVRFGQLVELALAFDARAGLRPTAFAALVRTQRVESPTAAQVKVMTVHASKGLEFDVVVLPQLAESLTGHEPKYVWQKVSPLAPTTVLSRAPLKELRPLHGLLAKLYDAVVGRALVDGLSALYVATTRAVHHLELIVPECAKDSKSGKKLRGAPLVREALTGSPWHEPCTDLEPERPGQRELWAHPDNDGDWMRHFDNRPAAAVGPRNALHAAARLVLAPAPRADLIRPRSPSRVEERPRSAAALLAPSDREARERGVLVHRLFEGLVWVDDERRDADHLRALLASSGARPRAIEEAVELYRRALAAKAIRSALTRPELAAGEEVDVLFERAFDVELDDSEGPSRWRGAIDRLVVVRAGARPVRAEVLDFKTDVVTADEVRNRAAHHRPQLEAYRRAAAALFGLAPEQVGATLVFLTAGEVVRL